MVQLARQDSRSIYVPLEGQRQIGRVEAPVGEPVLSPGAGTVLLGWGPGLVVEAAA
jgi:murein DD-endopeptidase MepM/ murein hydrolase activator NlpD